MTAKTLELTGDDQAAWAERLPALQGLPRMPDPERRYNVLEEATEAMEAQGRPILALAFLEEQAEAAEQARRLTGDGDSLIFTLLARQRVLRELGRLAEARAVLEQAEALWAAQEPDDDTRQVQRLDLDVQWALLEPRPGRQAAFDRALRYFSHDPNSLGDQIKVLRLWRGRAAQARRFGDSAAAAASLEHAIREIERQRMEIDEPELRARFLGVARDVFADRIALELAAGGSPLRALSYLERATNRLLLESSLALLPGRPGRAWPRLTESALAELAGDGGLVVRYGHLGDRLLLWSVTGGKLEIEQRPIAVAALRAEVAACRSAVVEETRLAATFPACRPLAELLLPRQVRALAAGAPLIVVPDELLVEVPFAALPDASGRRALVESHPLVLAPSLSLSLATPAPAPGESAASTAALFVVDPAFDERRFRGLERLPAARRSAALYAALYPHAAILAEGEATLSRLLPLLDRHQLFQFDGHVLARGESPDQRGLLLAAGGRDVMSAADLPARPFRRLRRVILAGCATAPRPYAGTSDWGGLAAAFLARGVPEVITTSWDVGDEPAAALAAALHRHLVAGEPAYQALQHAQLELLRSPDRRLAAPSAWAAYQCLGRLPGKNRSAVRLRESH
jgi:CHAT domain-containing protein